MTHTTPPTTDLTEAVVTCSSDADDCTLYYHAQAPQNGVRPRDQLPSFVVDRDLCPRCGCPLVVVER